MRWWQPSGNWRRWFSRKNREEDLDRELRSHLDLEAQEQKEAGVPFNEAGYAARFRQYRFNKRGYARHVGMDVH